MTATAPSCPLELSLGRHASCRRARCPWYRVPGTHALCAVEQWAPHVRHDARAAYWFVARRDEILAGRAHADPRLRKEQHDVFADSLGD